MIANGIIIALLSVTAWQVYETIMAYKRAEGTTWDRLKSAFRESATIAWSRLNAISVAVTTAVAMASDYFGNPAIKDTIAPYLQPEYMLAYTLVILIGAEISRRRTL